MARWRSEQTRPEQAQKNYKDLKGAADPLVLVYAPESPQRSLLVGVYPDLGVVPEIRRAAPQHGNRAPYLHVGRDAFVLV